MSDSAAARAGDGAPYLVLHVGDSPDSSVGGISRVVRGHLSRSYRHARPTVVASFDPVAAGRLRQQVPALLALREVVRRRPRPAGSAILHVHMSKGFSLVREGLLALLGRILGWRVVITWHASTGLGASGAARLALRMAMAPAHLVTVLSEAHAAVVPAARSAVVVVPNDVPVPRDVRPAREREPRVVFAGDVGARKGADVLLDAWLSLPDAIREEWCLDLHGRVLPELAQVLAEKAGDPSIRVHGPTDHQEVIAGLDRAAIAVLPSRAEALPMFLLEAMAHGPAVVGSRVGAVPALLDGGGGLLVEPGDVAGLADALHRLMASADLRDRTSSAGRAQVAAQYSTERATERWEHLYRGLLVDRPSAALSSGSQPDRSAG